LHGPNGVVHVPHTSWKLLIKKRERSSRVAEMRAEYDFSAGIRGKYAKRYAEGTNVVALEPDVAELFPDSKSVNEALRALVQHSINSLMYFSTG